MIDPPNGADQEEEGLDRILTVPNLITAVRLALIPVFVWLLFGRDSRGAAALLLAGLGCTDWVDGYIARRFHQVTTLGKILDPVADRALLVVAGVSILADGSVPWIVAIPLLVREVTVASAVLILGAMGAKRMDVSLVGKAAAFSMMVALPLFLVGNDPAVGVHSLCRVAAYVASALGIVFGYWSAAMYVPQARVALEEGRAARAA